MLLSLPPELVEQVALHVATHPPNLGPPAALVPLLATCRALHDALSRERNPGLYSRIARAKFMLESSGVPESSGIHQAASALPALCLALRVIRRGDVFHPHAGTALQLAYAMLLADDSQKPSLASLSYATTSQDDTTRDPPRIRIGKNKRQLGWAGVRAFALRWIQSRMWEGRFGERDSAYPSVDLRPEWATPAWRVGWPRDSENGAAALWVLWFFEDKATLAAEPDALRQGIGNLLLPFIAAPFRYASALAPPHHYTVPLLDTVSRLQAEAITVPRFHGEYPIYSLGRPTRKPRSPSTSPKSRILNSRSRILSAPPARLLFFARFQAGRRLGIPPHLPLTRAEAERQWREDPENAGLPMPVRPTQADLVEKNSRPMVRFEAQVSGDDSDADAWAVDPELDANREGGDERWAPERWRGRVCRGYGDAASPLGVGGAEPGRIGRVYELGSFAGLWAGTMMMPSEPPYTALVNTPGGAFPLGGLSRDDFLAMARPVYMRIREHRSYHPHTPAPPAPVNSATGDEGMANGWFPSGTQFRRNRPEVGQLEVRVVGGPGGEAVHVYETVDGEFVDGEVPRVQDGVHVRDECVGCGRIEERERRRRSTVPSSSSLPADWPDWARAHSEDSSDDDEGWERFADCDGVQDVVFTGETDEHHGQAWHHYEFSGRVRPWDGLIGLVMRPQNRNLGHATYFLSGHLVGRDTFEGTWQMASEDVLAPSWGGSLCMARGE
ncbi:hypothetical protein HMN09_00570300 [Mycena chlorophos]|uniref:F-box domain-containing protein n=1 Tax=Mycena chlorophos TaxID=658473 RepID=A0A8H6TCJ7_MYCCL|nr:hypothetical protein HMN09_00570300 [Mycena chlorophos]